MYEYICNILYSLVKTTSFLVNNWLSCISWILSNKITGMSNEKTIEYPWYIRNNFRSWSKYYILCRNKSAEGTLDQPRMIVLVSRHHLSWDKLWICVKSKHFISPEVASCSLILIYIFLLLSLGRCTCKQTISPGGYHSPSKQCFGTDMVY